MLPSACNLGVAAVADRLPLGRTTSLRVVGADAAGRCSTRTATPASGWRLAHADERAFQSAQPRSTPATSASSASRGTPIITTTAGWRRRPLVDRRRALQRPSRGTSSPLRREDRPGRCGATIRRCRSRLGPHGVLRHRLARARGVEGQDLRRDARRAADRARCANTGKPVGSPCLRSTMSTSPTPSPARRACIDGKVMIGNGGAEHRRARLCVRLRCRNRQAALALLHCARRSRRQASRTRRWRWPPRPGMANGGSRAAAARCGTRSPTIPRWTWSTSAPATARPGRSNCRSPGGGDNLFLASIVALERRYRRIPCGTTRRRPGEAVGLHRHPADDARGPQDRRR